jgi:hypothetical protein
MSTEVFCKRGNGKPIVTQPGIFEQLKLAQEEVYTPMTITDMAEIFQDLMCKQINLPIDRLLVTGYNGMKFFGIDPVWGKEKEE